MYQMREKSYLSRSERKALALQQLIKKELKSAKFEAAAAKSLCEFLTYSYQNDTLILQHNSRKYW